MTGSPGGFVTRGESESRWGGITDIRWTTSTPGLELAKARDRDDVWSTNTPRGEVGDDRFRNSSGKGQVCS